MSVCEGGERVVSASGVQAFCFPFWFSLLTLGQQSCPGDSRQEKWGIDRVEATVVGNHTPTFLQPWVPG